MTDEAFVFNSTVAERSSLKRAAQHKKNGPAVAKLGNKRMTAQEIRDRHGECKVYNTDGFMNFNDFKAMPKDIQVEYINKLQDKYDIGIKQISRILFHVGDEGLQSHLRINGILNQCNPNKRRAKEGLTQFQKDIEDFWREKRLALEAEKNRLPLGKFITYEEYQEFSVDDRIAYVNSLIDKYGVSINVVSIVLFGLKKDTLGAYFCGRKVRDKIKNLETRCNKDEKRKIFENAVNEWKGVTEVKEEELPFTVSDEQVVEQVIDVEPSEEKTQVVSALVPVVEEKKPDNGMVFKYSFVGDGDDLNRFKSIGELFGGKKVRVNIEIVEI